ncbi:Fic family protein [Sediminibacterium sp.]|uniref:Fic/DOC family protein n=1 Tax=Sediminibacterium sp. TaxID=1917865 RepID=UPI0025CF3B35|nr:Fic family protein [Sediminibacterium sp.]MDO8996271.1 Fic family protein [Sediminibacterium sp.]MDP2420011.1 Fic family protein [Sediminibacterium sp.]
MSNSYKYIDNQYTYIDPDTGLLKNLLGITDAEVLLFVESGAVTKRLQGLYENPIRINGIANLFQIHEYLFQDLYSWAGKRRMVEISKDGKQFFPIGNFDNALKFIDSLINEYYRISSADIKSIAQKLAEILDNINYLHPFREGNGRTQREFLRLLALEKGFHLNLNPPDNKNVYDRYMKGTVESDLDILTTLIFESLNSKDERKNGT